MDDAGTPLGDRDPAGDGHRDPSARTPPARTPSAADVLRDVMEDAARLFVENDVPERAATSGTGWLQPPTEGQVHQSRVAMRRMRSNLRTFRTLFDPAWNSALRADLAWWIGVLGAERDLQVLRHDVAVQGPLVVDADRLAPALARLDDAVSAAAADAGTARASERHRLLVARVDGVAGQLPFTPAATGPAAEVLPRLLVRTCHDLRGAGRTARAAPTDAHLHKLRIRAKALRYGAETAARVAGKPARKVARAAEVLQTRLGEHHDAVVSLAWLDSLSRREPDLAPVARELIVVQEATAVVVQRGWRRDLREIERRWRAWTR
ncbi:MAG: CHAD domain-containing protein [Actinomycetota bacterium]|nr:CHAD domain-containing protein [Actinomycetota bacterium]